MIFDRSSSVLAWFSEKNFFKLEAITSSGERSLDAVRKIVYEIENFIVAGRKESQACMRVK